VPAPTRRTPNWRAAARAAPPRRALVPSARAQDALIVLPGNLDVAPLHMHLPGPVAIRRGPQRVYVGLRPAVRERYGSERRGMRCCVFRPDAGCLCLGARQGSSPALHLARKRRDERLVWATGRRRVGSGDPRSARPQFASGFDTEGQPSKGDRFRRDAVARMGDPAQPLWPRESSTGWALEARPRSVGSAWISSLARSHSCSAGAELACALATIHLRRLELGGCGGPIAFAPRMRPVGPVEASAAINGLIPARRETWGGARFPRGLEAPAPTGQATRSGRRPRRARGSSHGQRTGPPARPRGTSADGGGKAMPPSRGSWRGGRRERFASWFRSRKPFRWVRLRRCRCRRARDRAANGEVASPLPGAWPVLRGPRARSGRRGGCGWRGAASGACRSPSDRDERERASKRGRAVAEGDNRHRAGRDCCGAAGSGSAQPSVLLAAREARLDHEGEARRQRGRTNRRTVVATGQPG